MILACVICSVSMAIAAENLPVKGQASEQKTTEKEYTEIYLNDLPDAIINAITQEGSMLKEAYVSYRNGGGSRIYKIVVLTSNLKEKTLYLQEDGTELPRKKAASIQKVKK